MDIKREFKDTGRIVKLNIGNILLFELAYRLLTLPLLFKTVNALIKGALKMSGYSYVTVSNLGAFLVKPWTVLAVLVIIFTVLAELFIEIACLITAYEAALSSRRLHVVSMFFGGLEKAFYEIRKRNWRLLLILAIHYLLTGSYLIYRLLCHLKPVKFILPGLMGETWGRLLLLFLVAGSAIISIPTAFVSFGCMVEQKSFRNSLIRSRELLKKRYLKTVVILVSCNMLVMLVWLLLFLFAVSLVAVFAVSFLDRRMELAVLLDARDKIEWVIIFLASITSIVVNYGALAVLYYHYSGTGGEKVPPKKAVWQSGIGWGLWLNRRMIMGLLTLMTAVSMGAVFDVARNGAFLSKDLLNEIQITAHRGSSLSAPENTIPALMAAVEELADYAEIDIQETKDGELVLFHDNNLKRVTGKDGTIKSMTLEELKSLDAGRWFSAEFEGTEIPTLEEAMDFAKGRLKLNIEIKNVGAGSKIPEMTAELIGRHGWQEQCVVTSTSYRYLERVKAVNPDIYTGYIVSAAYGSYYEDEAIDFVSLLSSSASQKLIDGAHESGKEVHVWTVNRKSEMERMKMLGVDNIITDNPVLAREVLYSEKNTENLLARFRELLK